MQAKFLPYCICIFLTCATARAATVTPAYKLGGSYASDSSTTAKCLEGHAGSTLGNPNCKDMSEGCKSNSECVSRFGDGWVCGKGRDGNAKRGVCRYQECSGWYDYSCSKKYSHLRSCVKNEVGVFECRITCNWQKIKEAGKAYIGSANVADRVKFEYALWKNPSGVSLSGRSSYFTSFLDNTLADKWYTCRNGRIVTCSPQNMASTSSAGAGIAATASSWDDGAGGGYRYQPCLPCVLATGGTWGVEAEEDITKAGNYPYTVSTRFYDNGFGIDLSQKYTNSPGEFWRHLYAARCGNYNAFVDGSLLGRLNSSVPFLTRVNSASHDADYTAKLGRAGLKNTVEMGVADICYVWHRRGSSTRYIAGKKENFSCADSQYCVQTTDVQLLVYVPKQNVTRKLYTAQSTGATRLVNVNFNQPNGTLLCCRIAAGDNSDVDNSSGTVKHCIAINPIQ